MTRRSLRALSLVLACSLAPLAAHAALVRVDLTNSAGDAIDVIDPATNKVVQQISIEAAHGINFAKDGSKVFVSNEATSTLDVFDRESGALIKKIALSDHPNNIAVTPQGDRVVVAIARGTGALDIVDAKTLTLTKTIPTHGRLHNVYVTPDGKYAVMGSIPAKMITVIDLATEQIAWELKVEDGVRPMTIEANDDGSIQAHHARYSPTSTRRRGGRLRGPQGGRPRHAAAGAGRVRNRFGAFDRAVAWHRGRARPQDPMGDEHPDTTHVYRRTRSPTLSAGQAMSTCPDLKLPGRKPLSAVARLDLPSRRTARRPISPTRRCARSARSTCRQ